MQFAKVTNFLANCKQNHKKVKLFRGLTFLYNKMVCFFNISLHDTQEQTVSKPPIMLTKMNEYPVFLCMVARFCIAL